MAVMGILMETLHRYVPVWQDHVSHEYNNIKNLLSRLFCNLPGYFAWNGPSSQSLSHIRE